MRVRGISLAVHARDDMLLIERHLAAAGWGLNPLRSILYRDIDAVRLEFCDRKKDFGPTAVDALILHLTLAGEDQSLCPNKGWRSDSRLEFRATQADEVRRLYLLIDLKIRESRST